MEDVELVKLIGIVVVIVGFALKMDAILIIMAAAIITALVSGLGFVQLLEILGSNFVANRAMNIFLLVLLVTGTMERNGLKESAAKLIGKVKNSTPGMVLGVYYILRSVFGAFNVSFGGVAGLVRPVVMPMAVGAIVAKGYEPNEEHVEILKGMGGGVENSSNFYFQGWFIGSASALVAQATMRTYGYDLDLVKFVIYQIPVGIAALVFTIGYYYLKDKRLLKKYYQDGGK